MLFWPISVIATEYRYTDAAVKAAYILNISHFVELPGSEDSLELCIIGDDLVGVSIASQKNEHPELYRTLKISKREASGSLGKCNMVYISTSQMSKLSTILYKTESLPLLTISDIDAFAKNGGMMELALRDNKVQLYINRKITQAHGIKVSAKLLSFAKQVYEE